MTALILWFCICLPFLIHVIQTFLEATQKFYNADLKAVDFIGAPEDCRVEINDWVEQQTESKYIKRNWVQSWERHWNTIISMESQLIGVCLFVYR